MIPQSYFWLWVYLCLSAFIAIYVFFLSFFGIRTARLVREVSIDLLPPPRSPFYVGLIILLLLTKREFSGSCHGRPADNQSVLLVRESNSGYNPPITTNKAGLSS